MLKHSYAVWLCFEFCQLLWPLLETCHTLMIKITYTSTHIANTTIHPQNKTPSSIMTLSPRLPSRIWAIQKEIKNAYPKKVCHMPKRHEKKGVPRKKKRCILKEGMPHVHKTCRKKKRREEKKYSPCPRKKYKERERSCEGVHPPSKKKSHTLAHLDQIVWLVYAWILFLTWQYKQSKHASLLMPWSLHKPD